MWHILYSKQKLMHITVNELNFDFFFEYSNILLVGYHLRYNYEMHITFKN
jgi:hypothetical protein